MENSDLSVFQYDDYCTYLKDYYLQQKKLGRGFSYRRFSEKAGIRSANYLKLVIDRKRPLSSALTDCFVKALKLDSTEAKYFKLLVKRTEVKGEAQERIDLARLRLRDFSRQKVRKADQSLINFFSNWYSVAAFEFTKIQGFQFTMDWFRSRVLHPISESEFIEALGALTRNGLVTKLDNGTIKANFDHLYFPSELSKVRIRKLHASFCELAKKSIENGDFARQDFSNLTFSLREEDYPKVCQKIAEFRRSLNQEYSLSSDAMPDAVYQLSISFFPLTKKN